jgi:rRNA maturation endonuclease Nob1
MSKITKNRMLAERYTTEEMKKDVNDLFKVIAEAKDEERYRRIQGIKLINIAYERIVSRNTEYIESIKRDYKHELAVIELTDEDSTVGRQAAEKVLF